MIDPTVMHVIQALVVFILVGWLTRLQGTAAKVHGLEVRLVKVETTAAGQEKILERLQEVLDDVREHMVRREDLEALRAELRAR